VGRREWYRGENFLNKSSARRCTNPTANLARARTLFPLGAMGANGYGMLLAIYDLDN